MRSFLSTIVIVAVLSQSGEPSRAEPPQLQPQVGEVRQIRLVRVSSHQRNGGSSGNSQSRDAVLERVIGVMPNGLELEYDLPREAAGDRTKTWQLPARILKPTNGPTRLLNSSELEARVEAWLKLAKLTRDACGRWYFTWNAFRVECDPQSVLKYLEVFDLRPDDLREGAVYRTAEARDAPLRTTAVAPDGATYSAEMEADPDQVRRRQAEADVVVGEITKKPLTLEQALRDRAEDRISGTIVVTFDTDRSGRVWRKTKNVQLTMERAGSSETELTTETVESRPVSEPTERRQ